MRSFWHHWFIRTRLASRGVHNLPLAVVFLIPTCLLLHAIPALATEGVPLKVRSSAIEAPAEAGQPFEAEIVLQVGRAGVIEFFELSGNEWDFQIYQDPVGVVVTPYEPVRVPYRAHTNDPNSPFELRVGFEGQYIYKTFDVSPLRFRQMRGAAFTQETEVGRKTPFPGVDTSLLYPEPGSPPDVAPKDRLPALRTIKDEASDKGTATLNKKRTITVQGRFVYLRDDGAAAARWTGVDAASVRVYDEDSLWDELLAFGLTDVEGNFSFSFNWDPGIFEDQTPDLYVEFELENNIVHVQDPGIFETDYTFVTGTHNDFTGSLLDVGWQQPLDESLHGAPHIHNSITRVWRWILTNEGYDTPSVDAQWPEGTTGAYHIGFFDEVYFSSERTWWEDTHAHEYGHHFLDEFGENVGGPNDYCNGICDSGDCGHCRWCEEEALDAFNEGWPNWLADVFTRAHTGIYGYATLNTRDHETPPTVCMGSGVPCPCDPLKTEGWLGALLRDIEDGGIKDDHAGFPGWKDQLELGTDEIFNVTIQDEPLTPMQFLLAFKARYPSLVEPLWETATNCGYNIDGAAPGIVTGLGSPSHNVVDASPDNTVTLEWTRATDDAAGIDGYGVFIGGTPTMPAPGKDIADLTQWTTPPLAPGTYYFSLRALDRAGNWSPNYASFGPVTIREAMPANLTFATGTGWTYAVIPSAIGGATFDNVPAPVVLLEGENTLWNARVVNAGEQGTGSFTATRLSVDGSTYLDLFNPNAGGAVVFPLQPSQTEYLLNMPAIYMDGGRHVLSAKADYGEIVAEIDESDNHYGRQWVWEPVTVAANSVVYRNSVPSRDGGFSTVSSGLLWYNCDGVRFSGSGWWNAAWTYAENNEYDFDIRLHQPSIAATSGFDGNVGWSTRSAGCLDAVFVNRNNVSGVQNWDTGVIRGAADTSSGARGHTVGHRESTLVIYGAYRDVTLAPFEMIDLFEFYVTAPGPVSMEVQLDGLEPDPLQVLYLGNDFSTGDLLDSESWATTDADGWTRIDVNMTAPGYNCLVLVRDPKDNDRNQAIDATIYVGPSLPDLLPLAPSGWYAPLVPRPMADGTLQSVPPPASLVGGPSTYFNVAVVNGSPTPLSGNLSAAVLLDGDLLAPVVTPPLGAGATATGNFAQPFTVRAGRHSLGWFVDDTNDYVEAFESNNVFGQQWSWAAPTQLVLGAMTTHPQPSSPAEGLEYVTTGSLFYNADGHRAPDFTPTGDDGNWAAVAVIPVLDNNVDLRIHEGLDDPQEAFTRNIVSSAWGPGALDMVLMNFNQGFFDDYDIGVLGISGSDGYHIQTVESEYLGTPAKSPMVRTLAGGDLVDLFEVYWPTAGSRSIVLSNVSGNADLGISVYRPDGPHYSKSEALFNGAAWFEPAGANEVLSFEVTIPGFHAVAVWKVSSDDTALTAEYELLFDIATDAPAHDIRRTALHSIAPNPFNPRTVVQFDLRTAGPAELSVYNLRGQLVRTLVRGPLPSGRHEIVWNGRDDGGRSVASGTYLIQLTSAGVRDVRKVSLLK